MRNQFIILLIGSSLLLFLFSNAFPQSSSDYEIPAKVFSGGGGSRTSSSYSSFGVVAEPLVSSYISSSNYEGTEGFIYNIGDGDTIPVWAPDTVAYPNDTINIPITIGDIGTYEIWSYEFVLTFDGAILNGIGATSENTVSEAWGDPLVNTSVPGQITIGGFGIFDPLPNGGILVFAIFEIVGDTGEVSPLHFESFIFNAGTPLAKPITDGSVRIPGGDSIRVISPIGGEIWCVDSTYNITWSSSGIDSVMIEHSIDGGANWDTIVASTPAVPGTYAWTVPNTPSANCLVRICDAEDGTPCDESDGSFTIKAPPTAPSNCVAGDDLCDKVQFCWQDNSDDETGFYIYRDGSKLDSVAADDTCYDDNNATPWVTYEYCVTAYNNFGESSRCCDNGTSLALPPAPTNVTAECIDDHIHVCWDDVAGESGCYIYRNGSLEDSVSADVNCYDDYNPDSGLWCYQISSYNICGPSPQSDSACDTFPCACQYPVHFVFTDTTGAFYNIVIDSAFLDTLELEECDEIGVFDDTGGGLLCVGASVYHPDDLPIPLTAWKDDPLTDVKDGYTPGDTMYFRVWSRNQDREECALSHFKGEEDGTFEWDLFSQLWLQAPCECPDLALHPGWQWVSTNIDPNPCEMESLFVNCWIGYLDIIQACDGSFCIPGVGCWIDCWKVCEMYNVHMADVCTIQVCGKKVPIDTLIPLPAGWNWIAYFPDCPLEPETALVSIWDNLDIVQNDAGEFCIPGVGCWIECMEHNEGYKLHLSSADTLIYPTGCPPCPPPFTTPDDDHHEFVKSTHFSYTEKTGESYSIVVNSVKVNGELPEIGDEIGVFTPSGLCVGGGVWRGEILGIAVWQDDDRTETVDGFRPGEQLVFKLWDKSGDKEVELSASYTEGDGLFAGGPFASVELSGHTDAGISHQTLEVNQNYPNPFNPATTISFNLPQSSKVTLKIYNLLGQEVRTLVDHVKEAGSHHISWDGTDNSGDPVSSGVYFYRLNAGEFSVVKKMIFMR